MSSAAKLGAFMLAILVVLGYFVLRVEDIRLGGGETQEIKVLFDSVAGLDEKSAVRVAGVRVGRVSNIALTPEGRALVTLEISDDIQIRRGASVRVASLGLLGEQYVELDPGPADAPAVADAGEVLLQGQQTASIDDVTNQVSEIAVDVKAITESLRAAIGGPEGTQRLEEIVLNVQDATARLRLILAANEENINATAANFRAITDDLRVEIPRIAASIDRVAVDLGGTLGDNREDVRALVQNLRTLSADLRTTTENLNDITGQVRSGEGTVGKLLYSDEAHDRLTSTLGSIEGGVGELRDVLGRVNRIGLQLGFDGYYLSDTPNTQFEGDSRIQLHGAIKPNIERNLFLQLGLTSDARGDRKETLVERTTTIDGVPFTTVTRTTRWDRDYLLSAQVGWEFDEWNVRMGLVDSFGGFGIDWAGHEKLRVTGEMFDFGSEYTENPQMRVLGRWRIRSERKNAPAIFVNAGVEDILNDPALMLGAGVRWTDEDLKYLLGSVPIP